ncbi:hypothetical protein [Metallosphaera hakonensis]|nr:hypothetical protein [Metallosphaera hakonensis]
MYSLSTYEVNLYLHEDLGLPVISENSGAFLEAMERLHIRYKIPGID